MFTATDQKESSSGINKHISGSANVSAESTLQNSFGIASLSELNYPYLGAFSSVGSSTNASPIRQSYSMTKTEQVSFLEHLLWQLHVILVILLFHALSG